MTRNGGLASGLTLISVALALAVLALDWRAPPGFAASTLYVFPVLLTLRQPFRLRARTLWPIAILCALLTAAGSYSTPAGAAGREDLFNRALALLAIAVTSVLVQRRGRIEERAERLTLSREALSDSIDGIVWEADPRSLRFGHVSRQAERILGYPVRDWLEQSNFWADHIHPEDRERTVSEHRRATAEGRDHVLEYRMIARAGHPVWLRDSVTVVAEEGQSVLLRGIVVDVSEAKQTEEALRQSTERLRTVVANAPIVLFALDRDGRFTLSEGRGLAALGPRPESVVGQSVFDLYQGHAQVLANVRRALAGEEFDEVVAVGGVHFDTRYAPLRDRRGEVTGVIGVATDITESVRAQRALRDSEARYVLAVRGANDGLWDWDLQSDRIYFSPRWKEMLGFAEDEVGDRPEEWLDRVHPDDLEVLQKALRLHLDGIEPHFKDEHRMRHRDGTYRWMLSRGMSVPDAAGKPARMAGSQTDITARMVVEQQLTHNAFHDALTGLPNRALFVEHLDRALDRARRRDDYQFAVLFIDLDRLKVVNDSLGHMAGDQLLVEMSQRLRQSLRPGDLPARFGGDEFAVLVDDIAEPGEAARTAERVQASFKPAVDLGTQEVFTTASIGIALSAKSSERAEELLRDADTAMYRAKALGGARHVVFHGAMHAGAVALLQLETDLRRALARDEFRLQIEYQPIVSLDTGAITGFEALGRWLHPVRGLIGPTEFIPVAEQTGLIGPIGRWMLRESCRQLQEWQEQFPLKPPLSISVNLSSKQLHQSDLVEQVRAVLEEFQLEPRTLSLEITESALVETAETAVELFRKLKDLSVKLQLDDFGTGYSSLSYLCRFPIDTVKIDRSFVTDLGVAADSAEVIRSIVTLAKALGMGVIAEGVETRAQMERLRELGCLFAQGYLFSRPMSVVAASALLSADPRW